MGEKEIKTVKDIDTSIEEGKMLISAIAIITTEYEVRMTPDQIIDKIRNLRNYMNFSK